MNVHDRLHPSNHSGRYAVVAMHSSRDEFYLVGRTPISDIAEQASQMVEEWTDNYIGIIYDMCDPNDRDELSRKNLVTKPELEDAAELRKAAMLCDGGR